MTITAASATGTVVRIGKGLTLHAQMVAVDSPSAACGTISRTFGAERHVQGAVSCRKCLDMLEGQRVHEARLAEEAIQAQVIADAQAAVAAEPIVITEEMVAQADADMIAHNEAVAAQAARSAAVGEWLEGTIEAIRAATPADTIKKGDVVTLIADGLGWTVRRINKDGSLRLINEEGKKINRKRDAVTTN